MNDKPSLRNWIKQEADRLDVESEYLLFSSPSRDPMWKGTDADHRNAKWFRKYWRQAVQGRSEESVHVRGVHYVMIEEIDGEIESPSNRTSWQTYANTTTCYNYLKDASVVARVLGYVPLDGIRDEESETVRFHEYGDHELAPNHEDATTPNGVHVPDVPDIDEDAYLASDDIDGMADYLGDWYADELRELLFVDQTSQQPFHVEIWSEKTPPSVLHDLAEQYGVNLLVTGTGDLSYQVAYNLANRINDAEKPGVILYLSDFDPKGDNMAQAMAGKLSWLDMVDKLDQRVVIKQLAVTREQIDSYDLPRTPIDYDASGDSQGEKAYESLVNDWEERKGRGATELQALWRDEARFTDEIEQTLADLYDEDLWQDVNDAKSDWQADAAEDLADAIGNADADERLPAVAEWVDEFNDHLDDVAETIEALNDLLDDDRFEDWEETVDDALEGTELDDLDPPTGEAAIPADQLFDSARGYGENITAIRRHEQGRR